VLVALAVSAHLLEQVYHKRALGAVSGAMAIDARRVNPRLGAWRREARLRGLGSAPHVRSLELLAFWAEEGRLPRTTPAVQGDVAKVFGLHLLSGKQDT
jgi:hypothetical protein